MSDSMNRNMLVLSLLFSWGLVIAMEDRGQSLKEALPAEMNVYVTQFLGSSLAETLRNIATLSQVDKYFNSLITLNSKSIGKMLRERFGDESLVLFEKALLNDDVNLLEKLMSMNIIKVADIENKIATILDRALEIKTYNVIHYLYKRRILNDMPLIRLDNEQLVTPFDYILQKNVARILLVPLFIDMIQHGANINQVVMVHEFLPSEEMTLLELALQLGDIDFFEALLELGADPTIKNKNGRSVINSFEGAPSFMSPFIKALKDRGFTLAMSANNRRGRTFTVQRKKIHHRGSSMASNSRKYNDQSI